MARPIALSTDPIRIEAGFCRDAGEVRAATALHRRERGLALEDGRRVPGGQFRHRRASFPRRAAKVRHEHDVLEREQIGVHVRLTFEDVERRTGDHAFGERPRDGLLVDDGTARGVDEKRRALHSQERRPIDEVARLWTAAAR